MRPFIGVSIVLQILFTIIALLILIATYHFVVYSTIQNLHIPASRYGQINT